MGSEKIYLDLLESLQTAGVGKRAAVKELSVQPDGKVLVESFARGYQIGPEGVSAADAESVSFEQKLAVVSYLLSDGAGEPAFDFVPFGHLGGYNIGRDQFALKGLKRPILKAFGENYERFANAALKMGGIEKDNDDSGKHVWMFHAFPQLPIQLTFHEGDEEFPADVQVMFDKKALDFMGLKCLGFLPGYFTSTLLNAASEY